MKECKYYCEGYYSDDIGYDKKDKIDACGLTQTGYHEMSYKKCSDVTNCYYKQLLAEQAKNKKLVEALEKIANTPKDANARISGGKGIDKRLAMAKHYIAKTTVLIAQQALNEVNNAK